MPVVAAIIPAALGAAKLVKGIIDEKNAKRESANLSQAFYQVQDEYKQNVLTAEQLSQQGFSQTEQDQAFSQNQSALGSGMAALGSSVNDPNRINELLQGFYRSTNSFAAANAAEKRKNIQILMEARKELAGQKNTAFAINELQPYERKLKEINQRRAAAQQTQWSGAEDIAGAASAYFANNNNKDTGKPDQPYFSKTPAPYSNPSQDSTVRVGSMGSIAGTLPGPTYSQPTISENATYLQNEPPIYAQE